MKKNHFFRLLFALLACHALLACGVAQAAISCNVTSNGFSVAYVPANTSTNITTASFTMTCTRSASGDATSQAYTVKANAGLQPASGSPQGASGANLIAYGIYIDGACATRWKNPTTLGGTITFASSSDFTPKSQNIAFYGCVPAGQTTVPAGTYTDTITMTPTPSLGSPATFPVSIVTPSSCSITTSPSTMTFSYTSLQGTAASTSTTFATTCTSLLPYTMALDATSGTLLNLAYTLSLSASSAVGNGAAQSYTINGSMASGQVGDCATASCSASASRVLTITY